MRISSTPTTRDTATREAPSIADTSRRSIGLSVPADRGVVKGHVPGARSGNEATRVPGVRYRLDDAFTEGGEAAGGCVGMTSGTRLENRWPDMPPDLQRA